MSSPSTTLGKAFINNFFGHAPAWYKQAILLQGAVALLLVVSLAFYLAAPGLVGLMIIVLQTAFNGITEEHQIGEAFREVLPFTAMLVTFFATVVLTIVGFVCVYVFGG
jgi:Na+/H+ antiporter NhaB